MRKPRKRCLNCNNQIWNRNLNAIYCLECRDVIRKEKVALYRENKKNENNK